MAGCDYLHNMPKHVHLVESVALICQHQSFEMKVTPFIDNMLLAIVITAEKWGNPAVFGGLCDNYIIAQVQSANSWERDYSVNVECVTYRDMFGV